MLQLKHSNVIVITICVSLLLFVFISLQKPETHSLYLRYDYNTPVDYKIYEGTFGDDYIGLDPFDEIESEMKLIASGTLASSPYYKVNEIQDNGSYTIVFESEVANDTTKTMMKCASVADLNEGDMVVKCAPVRYLSNSLEHERIYLESEVKNESALKLSEGLVRMFVCLVCGPLSV